VNPANGLTKAPAFCSPPTTPDLRTNPPADLHELRHEVGNALTVASAHAQRLLRRLPPGADAGDREALHAIRESIERAMHLLDSAEAASAARAPNGSDLRALVARARLEAPMQRRQDVKVEVVDSGPLAGDWDDEQVIQVIVNLLLNAAKYSTPGTAIGVEVGRFGPVAHVVVRDTGIGIATGDQEVIFNGHRTDAARQVASGSGIGLRVSRRLAEEQGGRLWVTSTPGTGSAFFFALPLRVRTPQLGPASIQLGECQLSCPSRSQ
jgi:two-component system, chemotaxis family, sensor kinase Cph1